VNAAGHGGAGRDHSPGHFPMEPEAWLLPPSAELGQEIAVPDQDRVGTDVIGSRRLAEGRQHRPRRAEAGIPCHPGSIYW